MKIMNRAKFLSLSSLLLCTGLLIFFISCGGDDYKITATAGEGGIISPAYEIYVEEKGSQTYTIIPNEGYAIADVLVNGTSVGAVASYTFENVGSDCTIHATFKLAWCNISADILPIGWETMEIEAKWSSNEQTHANIKRNFLNGSTFEGYTIGVRWGGNEKQYIDYYYDDTNNTLFNNLHSLRHRTRYTSGSEDWQKVQYKSTPYRFGAIWMRKEFGSCKIAPLDDECVCNDKDNILAGTCDPQHEAIAELLNEHPGFDFSSNHQVLTVDDYRYRILFKKDNIEYYEMSLDRIIDGANVYYEVELELVKEGYNYDDLVELVKLVEIFESDADYLLQPSIKSKGGITVPDECSAKSDLIVTSLKVTSITNNSIRYSYTIKNIGHAPANLDGPTDVDHDNVSVQAFLSEDTIFNNAGDLPAGGTILGVSPLGELDPDDTFTGSFGANTTVNPSEMRYLTIKVDWGDSVDELNEENNTASASILSE